MLIKKPSRFLSIIKIPFAYLPFRFEHCDNMKATARDHRLCIMTMLLLILMVTTDGNSMSKKVCYPILKSIYISISLLLRRFYIL